MFPPSHPAGYRREPPDPSFWEMIAAMGGLVACGVVLGLLIALLLW